MENEEATPELSWRVWYAGDPIAWGLGGVHSTAPSCWLGHHRGSFPIQRAAHWMQGTHTEPGTLMPLNASLPLKQEDISQARGVSGADTQGDGAPRWEALGGAPERASGKGGAAEKR